MVFWILLKSARWFTRIPVKRRFVEETGAGFFFFFFLSPSTSFQRFSSVSCPTASSREHAGRFSGDPFPVFSSGGHCEQLWRGQGCPLLEFVYPAFPLPTTASPILQGTLKGCFGEATMARDTLQQCQCLSPTILATDWPIHREVYGFSTVCLSPKITHRTQRSLR